MFSYPSVGNPNYSREDGNITKMLKEYGESLGIEVIDHIIVEIDTYFSFK
ncbi:JAB domain-containing protein [Metaclostridioides mangenotii]